MTELQLTEEKEKILKENYKVTSREEGKVYITMDTPVYCELLDLNYATLLRLSGKNDVYGDIIYEKVDETYVVACNTMINNEIVDNLSVIFTCVTDVLGQYSADSTGELEGLLSKTPEELKKYLEENYDDYSDLEDLFKAEINEEEIAEDYIKDNPSHAYDTALDYMSDYDMRDAIKDAIDRL